MSRASGGSPAPAANILSSRSIRLRGCVLPTCNISIESVLTSSEKSANFRVCVGIGDRSKDRMHSVRHHFQALARNKSAPDDLVANRAANAVHPGGLTEAAEDSPRHRTKCPRTVLYVRLQQTLERIEIVACDDASIGRQMMNQMTVAVIDNMKNVEARIDCARSIVGKPRTG